jgi:hypothetical protein
MVMRRFVHLTTETLVIAVALMLLALPRCHCRLLLTGESGRRFGLFLSQKPALAATLRTGA